MHPFYFVDRYLIHFSSSFFFIFTQLPFYSTDVFHSFHNGVISLKYNDLFLSSFNCKYCILRNYYTRWAAMGSVDMTVILRHRSVTIHWDSNSRFLWFFYLMRNVFEILTQLKKLNFRQIVYNIFMRRALLITVTYLIPVKDLSSSGLPCIWQRRYDSQILSSSNRHTSS